MAEAARVRVRISGRVQGVGFRYSAYHEARRLGLSGWVRNTRGSDVETEVAGAVDAVNAYVAWCRRGPSLARVTNVSVSPPSGGKSLSTFEIRT